MGGSAAENATYRMASIDHLIIKSWKRDPQVDGSKDLDDAAKKANAEIGGIEDGKDKGDGRKQPKKPKKPKDKVV